MCMHALHRRRSYFTLGEIYIEYITLAFFAALGAVRSIRASSYLVQGQAPRIERGRNYRLFCGKSRVFTYISRRLHFEFYSLTELANPLLRHCYIDTRPQRIGANSSSRLARQKTHSISRYLQGHSYLHLYTRRANTAAALFLSLSLPKKMYNFSPPADPPPSSLRP